MGRNSSFKCSVALEGCSESQVKKGYAQGRNSAPEVGVSGMVCEKCRRVLLNKLNRTPPGQTSQSCENSTAPDVHNKTRTTRSTYPAHPHLKGTYETFFSGPFVNRLRKGDHATALQDFYALGTTIKLECACHILLGACRDIAAFGDLEEETQKIRLKLIRHVLRALCAPAQSLAAATTIGSFSESLTECDVSLSPDTFNSSQCSAQSLPEDTHSTTTDTQHYHRSISLSQETPTPPVPSHLILALSGLSKLEEIGVAMATAVGEEENLLRIAFQPRWFSFRDFFFERIAMVMEIGRFGSASWTQILQSLKPADAYFCLPHGEKLFPSVQQAKDCLKNILKAKSGATFHLDCDEVRSVFTRLKYFVERDLEMPHRRAIISHGLEQQSQLKLGPHNELQFMLYWDHANLCGSRRLGKRGASVLQLGMLQYGSLLSDVRTHYNIVFVDDKDDAKTFEAHIVSSQKRQCRSNAETSFEGSVLDDLAVEVIDPATHLHPSLPHHLKTKIVAASLDLCAAAELMGGAGVRNKRDNPFNTASNDQACLFEVDKTSARMTFYCPANLTLEAVTHLPLTTTKEKEWALENWGRKGRPLLPLEFTEVFHGPLHSLGGVCTLLLRLIAKLAVDNKSSTQWCLCCGNCRGQFVNLTVRDDGSVDVGGVNVGQAIRLVKKHATRSLLRCPNNNPQHADQISGPLIPLVDPLCNHIANNIVPIFQPITQEEFQEQAKLFAIHAHTTCVFFAVLVGKVGVIARLQMDLYQHAILFCLKHNLRLWDIREDCIEETHHYEKMFLPKTALFGAHQDEGRAVLNTFSMLSDLIDCSWALHPEQTNRNSSAWFLKTEESKGKWVNEPVAEEDNATTSAETEASDPEHVLVLEEADIDEPTSNKPREIPLTKVKLGGHTANSCEDVSLTLTAYFKERSAYFMLTEQRKGRHAGKYRLKIPHVNISGFELKEGELVVEQLIAPVFSSMQDGGWKQTKEDHSSFRFQSSNRPVLNLHGDPNKLQETITDIKKCFPDMARKENVISRPRKFRPLVLEQVLKEKDENKKLRILRTSISQVQEEVAATTAQHARQVAGELLVRQCIFCGKKVCCSAAIAGGMYVLLENKRIQHVFCNVRPQLPSKKRKSSK